MKIIEAEKKEFRTKQEQQLKKRLIALLKDDGKGHKHAKYAARLADFDIKIAPVDSPDFPTAAIDFDNGTIYINAGFISDPSTFYQLNVLIRHEMAHNLLMHQIRMIHEFEKDHGKDAASHLKLSKSLHEIINIIEDFEISNKRYSDEDKHTVHNMWLNGQLIGGMITEEHRKNWANMSVEEMYKALKTEINYDQENLRFVLDNNDINKYSKDPTSILYNGNDFIKQETNALRLYVANSIQQQTNFLGTIEKFINNRALYHFVMFDAQNRPCICKFSSLPNEWQDVIRDIYDEFSKSNYQKQDLRNIIKDIAKSAPLDTFNIISKINGNTVSQLMSPEEKFIAIDVLKAIIPTLEQYQTWYDKVKKVLSDKKYSKTDLKILLSKLKK